MVALYHRIMRRENFEKAGKTSQITLLEGDAADILKELDGKRIYSHVGKRNAASLAVHEKCGFYQISDTAAYIDGSVDSKAYTLSNMK